MDILTFWLPLATLTVESWRGTTLGLQPNHRTAEETDRQTDRYYSYCRIDWSIMSIIIYTGCTYTEEWTRAADRVRVHLTHGLVVEQGHPEETDTHKSTWCFSSGNISLAYIDSLTSERELHTMPCS